jgi:hypothetical protein
MKNILQPLFNQFLPFAQKRMGFHKPPRIFLRNDLQNAQNPLGKTAYYDPEQKSITLYVHGRHPKDIMRSLSHELVHHTQNCNGEFDHVGEMGEGYAQNDSHLREMERQAYEQGNLCFRDWEDSIRGTIYNESLYKGENINMSTKDWKNNELSTLLTEKWGFSFNLLTESQEEVVEEEVVEEEVIEEEEVVEEEALDEGGAAARTGNEEKDQGRERMHADRLHEEELDEEAKKMVKCGDKGMMPDYACDGEGQNDEREGGKKEKMDEAQIRQLIRKLVKEAMNKKETK